MELLGTTDRVFHTGMMGEDPPPPSNKNVLPPSHTHTHTPHAPIRLPPIQIFLHPMSPKVNFPPVKNNFQIITQ